MPETRCQPVHRLTILTLVALAAVAVMEVGAQPTASNHLTTVAAKLDAEYSGELAFLVEQGVAEPLSLATADLDEDGVPDLVVGYGDQDQGLLAIHFGNADAVYPPPGSPPGDPFLPLARVFASASRADHLGAGDFDADGHFDVVLASSGGTTLELYRGDGSGGFAAIETVDLGGRLTAMAVGEVNRRDGLADVVAAVEGPDGARLLVFEWPEGALQGAPERVELADAVTSITLGLIDDDGLVDIGATTPAGNRLVRGRDRRLSRSAGARASVAGPLVDPWSYFSTRLGTTKGLDVDRGFPAPVRSWVEMRLNRDALPDHVAILEGESTPWVSRSLTLATFTVDSTGDQPDFDTGDGVCDVDNSAGDGPCTLRAAIEQANASAGADAVEFNIAGPGPHTIQPSTALPTIVEALTLDGFTQAGASPNTLLFPGALDSVLQIEVDGSLAPTGVDGLRVSGGSSAIRGVVVNRFRRGAGYSGVGVRLLSGGHFVEGCFVGSDPSGTVDRGNSFGVLVDLSNDNVVGGTAAAARNLISGNDDCRGVLIQGAASFGGVGNVVNGNLLGTDASGSFGLSGAGAGVHVNASVPDGNWVGGPGPGQGNVVFGGVYLERGPHTLVQGNLVGTNATGTAGVGSVGQGVNGLRDAHSCTIGGTQPGAGNVISGNSQRGVFVRGPGWVVQGNFIGVRADGVSPLGNGEDGLEVVADAGGSFATLIGGDVAGAGNVIAFNGTGMWGGAGIVIADSPAGYPPQTGNSILSNAIYANQALGINLCSTQYCLDQVSPNDPGDPDTGPNNVQNYPVPTAVLDGGATVAGTLNSSPSTEFRVELFANTTCDPSGHGEGETFLGATSVTTDAAGDAAFSAPLTAPVPVGSFVTATATDPGGNTSEFSACLEFVVSADLAITKDDGVTSAIPGEQVTYTIVAANAGPDDLPGATVADPFPAALTCSWTCVGAGGATCSAGPVAGDLADTADLPVGGSATYTALCSVDPGATGSLSNTATVAVPAGASDPNPANNAATDVDTILELDYGDAPDPTYPTLWASSGARHVLGFGLFLGASVDADPDGQPTPGADGDDNDGSDDEDGVGLPASLLAGAEETIQVTASASGLLNAWFDFNADGDWLDPGEQVFTDTALTAGVNELTVLIPLDAAPGTTFARFRFASSGGLAPTGLAADGEVEDHAVVVAPSAELEVAIADSPDPVVEGGALLYFVEATNNGSLAATGVTLADTLPPEVVFVSATPGSPTCTHSGGVVTCDLGTLASGATEQVVIEVDVPFGTTGTLVTGATVALDQTDPIPANNSDTESTTVADDATYIFSDGFESGSISAWSGTVNGG